ncbi:MAG: hypothetical protein LR008_02520 [Candidatus Pacebacteria bacterium]|nr:hypothetical protein [Candidatus Paceibacterota bacterium]
MSTNYFFVRWDNDLPPPKSDPERFNANNVVFKCPYTKRQLVGDVLWYSVLGKYAFRFRLQLDGPPATIKNKNLVLEPEEYNGLLLGVKLMIGVNVLRSITDTSYLNNNADVFRFPPKIVRNKK